MSRNHHDLFLQTGTGCVQENPHSNECGFSIWVIVWRLLGFPSLFDDQLTSLHDDSAFQLFKEFSFILLRAVLKDQPRARPYIEFWHYEGILLVRIQSGYYGQQSL